MKFAVALLAAMALCHVQAATHVPSTLYTTLSHKGVADIMIIMREPVAPVVSSINAKRFTNSGVKTTAMVQALREFTQNAQREVLSFLQTRRQASQVKSFWITNRISVRNAPYNLVQDLMAKFSYEIAEIREAKVVTLDAPKVGRISSEPTALEWGVETVQGPQAWAQGITGAGVVVSSIDTGVRATHESLRDGRRASYDWYDASSVNSQTPTDTNGHGTHTMGSMAGRNGTGVAPGSEWMHCRAFEGSSASEEALLACGEWITCPTLPDGREEDCSKKPNVCSNSWGGGNDDPFYNDVINAWQSANIVPVFAIGNSGPGCRSANSPGDQPNVISVGATNAQNLLTSFSSHGPSAINLRIKPEVSAPGNNIRSASNLGDRLYVLLSGTSMSCPHVAGAVALLIEKAPEASFEQIQNALQSTAFRPEMPDIICTGGGVNATNPWPNNSHGWGNVRANNALGAL